MGAYDFNQNLEHIFDRTERLLGSEAMRRLTTIRVILFGVGGVGSWCAESLVRTGICHLTIVDADHVCESNVNRQLMATVSTIGMSKVEAMRTRLLSINPDAEITAIDRQYTSQTAPSFCIGDYDYVIDAIDSLADKAHLILYATQVGKENGHTCLFSSMGAALRTDPFSIRQAEFWRVKGDPLARALRQRYKRMGEFPAMKFQCVYSEQAPLENLGDTSDRLNPDFGKVHINGSLSHVTMMFGAALAGMVINRVYSLQNLS